MIQAIEPEDLFDTETTLLAMSKTLMGRLPFDEADAAIVDACFDDAASALAHASSTLGNQDIILATGSFVTVELILRELGHSGEAD